jgi:hypothetical protein
VPLVVLLLACFGFAAATQAVTEPTVSIFTPTNGQVFVAPADIGIVADAGDADGGIVRVEFYEGDTLLGEALTQPYSMVWSNVMPGNYQITAVAVDDSGLRSEPARVDVIVAGNLPPFINLIRPTNGASFVAPTTVQLQASASDPDGVVTQVQFFQGTELLSMVTNAPYNALWTNVAAASYAVYTVAVDNAGASSTSAVANIVVRENIAPSVAIVRPTNGALFLAPAQVFIIANATDVDGFVPLVEFFDGERKIGQATDSPFGLVWNGVAPGSYTLTAVATDNRLARATSAPVNIEVLLPGVVRGPYLQLGTPSSVIVRWRTDVPTDSVVRWGGEADLLANSITNGTRTTEHEVQLSGLSADTRYYYSVGFSLGVLAEGPGHYFLTAPAGAKPTRVWVLGDSGTADFRAVAVRDAYYNFAGTNHTDLWLMLGDNAYWSGLDDEYQIALFDIYPQMLCKSVLWSAIGNHDYYGAKGFEQAEEFPYLDIFTLPASGQAGGVASGTERYYSFDYGNIHFVCLDSMTVDRSSNAPMCNWLKEDLAANTNQWLIAYFHHPPYSKGSHDSDLEWEFELIEMRENVNPILEAYGVDLVLAGHSHCYERSFLLNGHYGYSDSLVPEMIVNGGDGRPLGSGAYINDPAGERGTVYMVAGSSGQATGGDLNHPAMFISLNELGSLVLDVHGDFMDVQFLRETGAIDDSFTIVKGTFTNALVVSSVAAAGANMTLSWTAIPGHYYVVETANDLMSGWSAVTSPIRAVGRSLSWSCGTPGATRCAFFRVVELRNRSEAAD